MEVPDRQTSASEHPYSSLSPERILDAVDKLSFCTDGRFAVLNSYENRVYQVGIEERDPLIAKFYRPERWSRDQLIEEHLFSAELMEAEWPVVAPLDVEGRGTLHIDGVFHYALFPRFGGHAPELDNHDTLEMLGRALGRLHAIGSQKPFRYRPSLDLQSYGIESRTFLLEHEVIPPTLRAAYETLTADLLERIAVEFDRRSYTEIRIHADCHPGNILWRDDRALFVDFDDCRMGPAVQDLWMLLSGERGEQMLQLDSLLEGYEMFFEFDEAELALIEPLRTLRMMHYAAWIARRWADPAFPKAFPWFNTERYWGEHILELREQMARLNEAPLSRPGVRV